MLFLFKNSYFFKQLVIVVWDVIFTHLSTPLN